MRIRKALENLEEEGYSALDICRIFYRPKWKLLQIRTSDHLVHEWTW